MFLSLHSHVLRHSVFSSRPKQTKPHLKVFFSHSVVALRISSRLSPWRFQIRIPVLSSAGEARTTSVLMPPSRWTRRLAADELVNIPADLVLDSLFVKDCPYFVQSTELSCHQNTLYARRMAKRSLAKCTIYWRPTLCPKWQRQHRTPATISASTTTGPRPAEPQLFE